MAKFAATIRNVDPEDYRYICRKTLTGPAGREYRRYIEQNDDATWQEIKTHLGEKYDDPDRSRSALTQIFNLQQRPHELVQGFADRLQTLTESAYTPTQRTQSAVDLQLVTIFTNGLTDDYIVRRLLEGAPATLEDAVELAMTLQNGSRTVEFNRHHFRHRQAPEYYPQDERNIEPMDYMAMMRQQSAQMEGKINSLTNGIQQLVGAMNKGLKHKKEHKKGLNLRPRMQHKPLALVARPTFNKSISHHHLHMVTNKADSIACTIAAGYCFYSEF